MAIDERHEDFYGKHEEPNQSCLLALRDVILDQDERIYGAIKYGMPCFCIGKRAFCYLWVDKKSKEPYILIVDGHIVNHPALEKGSRKKMKIYRVDPLKDLNIHEIKSILKQAIQVFG